MKLIVQHPNILVDVDVAVEMKPGECFGFLPISRTAGRRNTGASVENAQSQSRSRSREESSSSVLVPQRAICD